MLIATGARDEAAEVVAPLLNRGPEVMPANHQRLLGLAYAAEVTALRSEGLIRGVPVDVAERFFALGFSLEQMRQNLNDLDRCQTDWCEKPAEKPASAKV